MSGNTSTTGTHQFTAGDKVRLLKSINGTIEKNIVYNDPDTRANRKPSTMPEKSEVFIRKIDQRSLLGSSTGPGASASDADYTFEKVLKTKYRLVKDTADIVTEPRIPHTSLSQTEGGKPDEAKTYTDQQYLYVIKEFTYTIRGKKGTVFVNDIIQIIGRPITNTGKALPQGTAHATSATYAFRRTDPKEKKPICWRSDHFHPASVFEKI